MTIGEAKKATAASEYPRLMSRHAISRSAAMSSTTIRSRNASGLSVIALKAVRVNNHGGG
jgi:hypothetical protein